MEAGVSGRIIPAPNLARGLWSEDRLGFRRPSPYEYVFLASRDSETRRKRDYQNMSLFDRGQTILGISDKMGTARISLLAGLAF